ncbi:MAG: phosphatidylserine decarboxylase family protein [Desulfobacterales bacterium]|nr:MAG: phosphatidylserine decarboxylase family protein [Desulfobacterales bacterium]
MKKYTRSDPPSQTAFPVASAGYPFIFSAAFVTAVLALLGLTTLTLVGLVITFAICGFFRDPDRVIPDQQGAVVSPADGKVVTASLADNSPFYDGQTMKISIFMSVFNVHVNRAPYEGRVKEINYHPGKFIAANFDKASLENEHNAVFIETQNGKHLCVVQVAGLIARRIICKIKKGDNVIRGQRFGLICFGSRLDVYLPPDIKLNVAVGDKVQAGVTILGEFAD